MLLKSNGEPPANKENGHLDADTDERFKTGIFPARFKTL